MKPSRLEEFVFTPPVNLRLRGQCLPKHVLATGYCKELIQQLRLFFNCAGSLLKFRPDGGQQTYDLYRDAAAGVVTREGGGLAYMGAAVVRTAWPLRSTGT